MWVILDSGGYCKRIDTTLNRLVHKEDRISKHANVDHVSENCRTHVLLSNVGQCAKDVNGPVVWRVYLYDGKIGGSVTIFVPISAWAQISGFL